MKLDVGRVGYTASSQTEHGERIQYKSPAGTQSESAVNGQMVTLEMSGVHDIGRKGEPAVVDRIVSDLRARGEDVVVLDAEDSRGEDSAIKRDDQRLIIQVVTAPKDRKLFSDAAKGVAHAQSTLADASGWIEQVIEDKASLYDAVSKQRMLLAIDVRHLGVILRLVDSNIRAKAAKAGFSAVWLIGPDTTECL